MAFMSIVLGENWRGDEWPDYVEVRHDSEVSGRGYVPERTCRFIPSETERRLDENDVEHDTGEPSDECPTFVCSACGSDMMYGDGGWFDLEPPHKPRFGYCPYCGARVEFGKEVG